MTSYAIALDKEIAMLNEKMSKLQKEKKEEETLKEKEIQKEEKQKRKEEISKEFAEYDDMMIIQKIYPKFFTITADWDLKVKNPEYVEYFNKTLKLIKECDIQIYAYVNMKHNGIKRSAIYDKEDDLSCITLDNMYKSYDSKRDECYGHMTGRRISLGKDGNLSNIHFGNDQIHCEFCKTHYEFSNSSFAGLLRHMEKTKQEYDSLDQFHKTHPSNYLCKGRYNFLPVSRNICNIEEKLVSECTEYYKILDQLKKICVEPPPMYIRRLRGETSPKWVYDYIITNDEVDLDTHISIFIDKNPQYRVTPIHGNKYMLQNHILE